MFSTFQLKRTRGRTDAPESAEERGEYAVIVKDSVDVAKARDWIEADFQTCSCWGRLTRLLAPRIAAAPRSVAAFVGKWVDVAALASYEIGAPPEVRSADPYGDELAAFVQGYLATSDRALLLCQVGSCGKYALTIWDWSVPPRYFEDREKEGYYALKSEDRQDFLRIEATLSAALGQFGAAICTMVSVDRLAGELDESILEEAAGNAEYLIVEAFDGDGYLVWEFGETGV